ncbi:hypothetical protein QP968_00695 [Corynebacterium sp. MSK041]|uniref:VG15 protein n=1 Tax=Corynebacterium sp. MSK041 TaxID=3050194 RepID=UPI00254E8276|nr:hypothetical protein [Corynebacterium sp. MSK041]MDK8794231.1 hypothetical protein [Corynebacterium sp. MSK041]
MTVSEVELRQHRDLLRELLRMANGDLLALLNIAQSSDPAVLVDLLLSGVPEIVDVYRAAAVDVGAVFYAETQGLQMSRSVAATASSTNVEQLERSLRWAVFGAELDGVVGRVAGILQKHVVDGSRAAGALMASEVGQQWVRAAHPGACQFCRLLATRGLDGKGGYSSKETASLAGMSVHGVRKPKKGHRNAPKGSKFHENCMCVPVLAGSYTPPDYVLEWEQDYFKAYEAVGGASDQYAILAKMREISGHNH